MNYIKSSFLVLIALAVFSAHAAAQTSVSIVGEDFHINGKPTYAGRVWNGHRIEGLLMNSRMVQATFDDLNSDTAKRWAYADTGTWDAERNVKEFIAAMPEWKRHGLLAVTVNFQGGSPEGYSKGQPWITGAFNDDGSLRSDFTARMKRVLDAADANGMVVILGYFYFGQDRNLKDEASVIRATDEATHWLLDGGWQNVLVEVNNETNQGYHHDILRPARVHELIDRVRKIESHGRRLLAGTSYGGGHIPQENVVRASDFLLLHGNGVKDPARSTKMIDETRRVPGYRPMPILFNEDDHENFDQPANNCAAAVAEHVSWGWFDFRRKGEGLEHGYQSPPVNWGITSPRKRAFFNYVADITGAKSINEKPHLLPKLKISNNHHFLVTASGQPFFWQADTAWELFHRLNREDAEHYLMNRAKRGFNVVQAVALAEFNGLTAPNAYGHLPLKNNDPLQPNEDYFKHVDWIVAKANSLGIYVGFLPTWGDKWNKKWGAGPEIFTPQNAEAYGEWLGRRYKDAGIVWILGGDRPVENDTHKDIIRAMARGLRTGDGGAHLITFHPTGGKGSSEPFHNEDWLDFNMRQNGHVTEFTGRFEQTRADYDRQPVKPVLDAEPIYEGHPVAFDAKKFGHSVAADIRRAFYWDVFTGACGHTYGHHSVWAMHSPKHAPVNSPLMPWTDAINEPGAAQVGIGRRLIESRPFLTRVPDDSVLVPSEYPTLVPGAGTRRFVATRDQSGSYAMIYVPVGRTFAVRMDKITGPQVKAWWFNPRDGSATAIGIFENKGEKSFTPPTPGELLDWVLVLDDAAKAFPQPGDRP